MTRRPEAKRGDSLAIAVVRAVADREGLEPARLEPPLHEAIDTDALDRLFAPSGNGRTRTEGQVTFDYGDYLVRASADRRVSVERRGDSSGSGSGSGPGPGSPAEEP